MQKRISVSIIAFFSVISILQAADQQLELVGFGCVSGFGGWTTPPKDKAAERHCDQDNLRQFGFLIDRCHIVYPYEQQYDLNHDQCVTCADYQVWKKMLKGLYAHHDRSTDGQDLTVAQCDKTTP